jgi:hypothetical protein
LGYRPITRFFATRSFLSLQSVPIASVSFDGFSPILSLDQKSGWIIGAVELQPISTAKLYREDDDRELKFLNDQDGKTTSLMFGKLEAKRE